MTLDTIVDQARFPLASPTFSDQCAATLEADGVLTLDGFILPDALQAMKAEAAEGEAEAYFCTQTHSVYLTPHNPAFPSDHPANRQVVSSKGCICDDVVAAASPLRALYDASVSGVYRLCHRGGGALSLCRSFVLHQHPLRTAWAGAWVAL